MRAERAQSDNDTISIYSGDQPLWSSPIKNLPRANGRWKGSDEATFFINLGQLPGGGGSILEEVDRCVSVSVQDDTSIDYMRLYAYFDCCARACGTKFEDVSCNGQKDGEDPPLSGWTISISDAQGETRTTTTDADGEYCFDQLQPGTYNLGELAQTGWVQTFPPAPGRHVLEVAAGDRIEDLDFGNQLDDACHEPSGACCTRQGCLEKTFEQCQELGGLWAGQKSCHEQTCSERGGACCTQEGCILTLADGCEDRSGLWQGAESNCDCQCPDLLTVTATPDVGVGCDRFNGLGTQVTLTIDGGTGPFECEGAGQLQERAPDARQCVFLGMSPGTYTYGVKDLATGKSTVVQGVKVEPLFELSITHGNPTYPGCANGTASFQVIDDEPPHAKSPFTYRWQPTNQVTAVATGLAAGAHSILVTDANGCWTSAEVTLLCEVKVPDENSTSVYFRSIYQSFSGGGFAGHGDEVSAGVEFEDGLGLNLGLEYAFNEHLGLDVGVLYTEVDITTSLSSREAFPVGSEEGSEELLVWYAGSNIHLFPNRRYGVYFGPFAAFLDLPDPPGLKADDEIGLGIVLGFDVPLGSGAWTLSGALRYLDSEIDLVSHDLGLSGTLEFDLLSAGLGISNRF